MFRRQLRSALLAGGMFLGSILAPGAPPSSGAPINSDPPALLGDPYTNATIVIDSGAWSGTLPFTFSYRLRTTAGVTLANWTQEPEFDLSLTAGQTLLLDVECMDALGRTSIATSAAFGPITAPPFVPTVVAALNFRSTAAHVTDGPAQTYVLATDTVDTTRGGYTFRVASTSHNNLSPAGVSDPRLRGRADMTSSLGRVAVPCPVGNVRIKLAMGLLSSSAGNVSWEIWDGEPGQPGSVQRASFTGAVAANSVCDATGAIRSYSAWTDLDAGAPLDTICANGSIWLRRLDSNALRLNHLYIETRAP